MKANEGLNKKTQLGHEVNAKGTEAVPLQDCLVNLQNIWTYIFMLFLCREVLEEGSDYHLDFYLYIYTHTQQ